MSETNGNGIAGQIIITMVKTGQVVAESNCPGGVVQMLGMLEAAKTDLIEALRKKAAAEIIPPSPEATLSLGR